MWQWGGVARTTLRVHGPLLAAGWLLLVLLGVSEHITEELKLCICEREKRKYEGEQGKP